MHQIQIRGIFEALPSAPSAATGRQSLGPPKAGPTKKSASEGSAMVCVFGQFFMTQSWSSVGVFFFCLSTFFPLLGFRV